MRPIIRFTYLSFQLNSLLDKKKFLDYQETINHIESGNILEWLKEKFSEEIDLSLYDNKDKKEVVGLFQDLTSAVDAKKQFGVNENGISLLLAYCLEGIQRLK